MSDQDSDRLIDDAAAQMLSHQPSRQLKRAVMDRLREPERSGPRRLVWATSVAALAVCGVVAIVLLNRPPALESRPPAAMASVILQPDTPAPSAVVTAEPVVNHQPAAAAVTRQRPAPARLPPDEVSAIEPLETEPIVIAVVEVPPLARETVSFDQIDIEPLTIEPLTASND